MTIITQNKTLLQEMQTALRRQACVNKTNNKKLGKQNNQILHRTYKNKPLSKQQKQAGLEEYRTF